MRAALMLTLFAAAEAEAGVTMYGAAWCGPCRTVKAFLGSTGVAFEYVDIDEPAGRARYLEARGSYKGIPLIEIGRTQIRGANLEAIGAALERENLLKSAPPKAGGTTYGGHSPEWWQQQFRDLRRSLAEMEAAVAAKKKDAIDHYEKELLAGLEENRDILAQSIDQLENDASNVSLPRKYRE
jgi:glutaredoxin